MALNLAYCVSKYYDTATLLMCLANQANTGFLKVKGLRFAPMNDNNLLSYNAMLSCLPVAIRYSKYSLGGIYSVPECNLTVLYFHWCTLCFTPTDCIFHLRSRCLKKPVKNCSFLEACLGMVLFCLLGQYAFDILQIHS